MNEDVKFSNEFNKCIRAIESELNEKQYLYEKIFLQIVLIFIRKKPEICVKT